MTAVLDASVVVKILTEEPLSNAAVFALAHEQDPIAPDLLGVEVASALTKKVRLAGLPRDQAEVSFAALPVLSIELVRSDMLLPSAMSLSLELQHALQDCLYLALAEARDCQLITADEKFASTVEASPYAHRVRRLREATE